MYCKNCGKPKDDDSKFCMHCGQTLKPDTSYTPQPIVDTPEPKLEPQPLTYSNQNAVQQKSNSDNGYFIIAIMILLNVAVWFLWNLSSGSTITGNESLYKAIRSLSVLFAIAQFIIMLVYTKRQAFKVIIAIIGLLIAAYDIYYVVQDFKRF